MPMHAITSRAVNSEERRAISWLTKQGLATFGCIAVFSVGVSLAVFRTSVASIVAGLFVAFCLAALIVVSPTSRRFRQRAAKDAESHVVEELHVSGPRVCEIGSDTDNEPVLVFDIGEGKLLLLQGQWLRDATTYGANPRDGDPFDEYLNGLPAPYSFPSTDFTVIRLPHSGEVLRVLVGGKYLKPDGPVVAMRAEYEFGMSEILDGRFEEVADVLEAEHARRLAI
jgi:hypothetical protein